MSLPEEVLAGARLFDAEEYFEAHEAWEDHWGKGSREEREATLGLIKAAVACHHLKSGNPAGFAWQAAEAVPRLRAHHAVFPDLRLPELAEELDSLAAQIRFHGKLPEPWVPPRICS